MPLKKVSEQLKIINHDLGDILIQTARIRAKLGWRLYLGSALAGLLGFLLGC